MSIPLIPVAVLGIVFLFLITLWGVMAFLPGS